MLRSDADHEIEHLVNAFTVNETYFYREDHQLRCMTSDLVGRHHQPEEARRLHSHLVDPLLDRRGALFNRNMADGELEGGRHHNIEIVGSDIDTRALKAAAEGIYGARALMRLSSDVIERYFERIDGESSARLIRAYEDSVQFTRANLIDAPGHGPLIGTSTSYFAGTCLIYFDDASRRIAAENLYDCLRPGGYICLGHSETMSRISPLFGVCRFPDAIVYQKPEADRDGK